MGKIIDGAKRFCKTTDRKVKQNSDKIAIIGGVIFVLTTVGTTIIAARKVDDIIADHKTRRAKIDEAVELAAGTEDEFTDKEILGAKIVCYGKTAWEMFKCWAPTVFSVAGAIACPLMAYKIVDGKKVAALGALAAQTADFEHYRGNVVKELGTEADEHFMYDTEDVEIEDKVVTENGKEKTKKKKVKVATRPGQFDISLEECKGCLESTNDATYLNLRAALLNANSEIVRSGFIDYNGIRKEFRTKGPSTAFEAGVVNYPELADEKRFIQIIGMGTVRMSTQGQLYLDTNDGSESEEWKAFRRGQIEPGRMIIRFKNIQPTIKEELPRILNNVAVIA